ncbi:MAG: C1 family peptidase [Flavobacteriaceae bacterium]|jgi:hypothetical protein|nr:C1 family peptidase [Flavobacteriaceae bacterium]
MKKLIKKVVFSLSIISTVSIISCSDDPIDVGTSQTGNAEANGRTYGMGWIPSEESDWEGIPEFNAEQLELPSTGKKTNGTDFRISTIISPFDQGPYATSTAVALARNAYTVVYKNITGMPLSNPSLYKEEARIFSPAFLYVVTKTNTVKSGKPVYNLSNPYEGVKITDAFKVMESSGVCVEANYPYPTPKNLTTRDPELLMNPVPFAIGVGAKFNRGTIFRIKKGIDDIKKAINTDAPVVFGMNIPLVKNTIPLRNGKVHYGLKELTEDYNNPGFEGVGGHAMTIIGYNDGIQAFLVQNSWGENWGGEEGSNSAPKGCFWLKYDLVGQNYKGQPILADFCTFTFNSQNNMVAKSSILYEFSGYAKYPKVVYPTRLGSMALIKGQPFPGPDLPVMNLEGDDYFEYPRGTAVPAEGTVEFQLYVKEGYRDTYKSGTQFVGREIIKKDITIFSTFIDRVSESYNETESSKGGIRLQVSEDGEITVKYAVSSFDETIVQGGDPLSPSPGGNVAEKKVKTSFKLNQWNTLAVSYGSQGIWVKVNGYATQRLFDPLQSIKMGGNQQFTFGKSITSYDSWRQKYVLYVVPITGPVYGYNHGTGTMRAEGFHGYVKAFRTSGNQYDWAISNY